MYYIFHPYGLLSEIYYYLFNVLFFLSLLEFIVEADIAACGDNGQTCIEDISIQLNGESVHFNFAG